jgi:cell surface protein SprA
LTYERGRDQERTVLEIQALNPGDGATVTPATWAGLTHSLSTSGANLSLLQSIEIWVNDHAPDHEQTHAKLHLDFGSVSEDAFWNRNAANGILDTEDKNGDTKLDRSVDPRIDEDTGLDGVHDVDEPGFTGAGSDPNRDDYYYDLTAPGDFSKINGLENNGKDDVNARPDTEDLDLNGRLEGENSYFEATIDLADSAFVIVDVPRDYAGNLYVKPDNGWRLFRLPVPSAFFSRGSPAWNHIKHVRLWLDGMIGPTNIQIGGISPVGVPNPVRSPIAILYQSYPNPFNPQTTIEYETSQESPVRLAVYNVNGLLVRVLTDMVEPAGLHRKTWSGQDAAGRPVASGVYFYRLDVRGASKVRRMVLAR